MVLANQPGDFDDMVAQVLKWLMPLSSPPAALDIVHHVPTSLKTAFESKHAPIGSPLFHGW